jgi:anti-anti-sigma factor
MSIAHSAPVPVPRPAGSRGERNILRARELSATTVLIAAVGEIDASNSADFLGYVKEHVTGYRQLVLDLSRLDFFGTAGFSALHTVNVRCSHSGVDWVLVPGQEVARLLRVCDPEGGPQIAGNIVSAVATLVRGPRRLLHYSPPPD